MPNARGNCAPGVKAGEIVIFDKAYVDFGHLADLSMREVFWVTRAKDNMQLSRWCGAVKQGAFGKILRDDLIELQTPVSRARLSGGYCAGSWPWSRWTDGKWRWCF